ncbi:hypothetical protein BST81_12795 [Leptolyngbya sp. 'hensonii']|uniref:hypothetical protein n=1 Tax=Leptolyngbya sp. 'hensonii' TaxID=1922337 RepID=UPI00094F7B05|nr:hypothetical protein [Leptolyngbya sp. 'hensonii']OLP17928.1 hypothetical protein BST81_12795 [Leptolyngbya sp. 'hensonii']
MASPIVFSNSSSAAPPLLVGQFSLPAGSPLDSVLNNLLNQSQALIHQTQQQVNTLLGPVQQDLQTALQDAFGSMTLDVNAAEHNILDAIEAGTVPSTTGINPVLEQRTTATRVLTAHHKTSTLSQEAQATAKQTIETTQQTLAQVHDCNEQGKAAQSTQDALKSLLCQQSGMASMDATLIPLLQKTIETNVGIETNLSLLNDQINGQFIAAEQRRMAETSQSQLIRSSFSSLLYSPKTVPAMQLQK